MWYDAIFKCDKCGKVYTDPDYEVEDDSKPKVNAADFHPINHGCGGTAYFQKFEEAHQ